MPELPEVETIKRQLNDVLVGQNIKRISVLRTKSFSGNKKNIINQKIVGIDRKAKNLIIQLNNNQSLLIHLKMTGQLIYQKLKIKNQKLISKQKFADNKKHFNLNGRIIGGHPSKDWFNSLPSSHTRVVIKLSKGTLFFNDMRVFGWIRIVTSDQLAAIRQSLPPDVVDREFNAKYLTRVLKNTSLNIKTALLNQQKMGGIGNIYASDALHLARIDPRRPANSLTMAEYNRLTKAIKKVINKGIKLGGASESDYVHLDGAGGKYQEHFRVYKQTDKKCGRGDGGVIKKIKLNGRGTYYCPKCQT